jgi:hypothetical protein
MNVLLEKKYGVPSHNFVKKNVLCEKGDEITRFDGTADKLEYLQTEFPELIKEWVIYIMT